jgi:rhodanese-related sulfurtransferase
VRPTSDLATAPRVDQARARELYDRRAATFVDVRSPALYDRSHIPGATSVPIQELARRLGEIPRDKPVVVY